MAFVLFVVQTDTESKAQITIVKGL